MSRWKRILILLGCGALLIFLSLSYSGQDISARAIVLGVGVDWDSETQQYIITAEIVSPGGGSDQQVGTFSKLVEGRGDTMAHALSDIYAQTGRKSSLGQCQILLLGESMYKNTNMLQSLSYFSMSEAFKDSSSVCCTVGEANALMNTQLPLSGSISFTLVELLKDAGKLVAIPSTTLNKFTQSQMVLTRSGVLSVIEYVESKDVQKSDNSQDSEKPQGTYKCNTVAVFKDNKYVTTLDDTQSLAYTLLATDCIGQIYTVKDDRNNGYNPELVSAVVTDKSTDIALEKDGDKLKVTFTVDTEVHGLANGYHGKEGIFFPKWTESMTDSMLSQIKQSMTEQLNYYFEAQKQYDFDVVNIYKAYEIKYGSMKAPVEEKLPMDNIEVNVKVEVTEN